MTTHADQSRAIHRGPNDLGGLEVLRNEDPCLETGPRRLSGDGIRQIAGGGAADRVESERGGRIDRRRDDPILEGQRRM